MPKFELDAVTAKVDEAELTELLEADASGGTGTTVTPWLPYTPTITIWGVSPFPTSSCSSHC